MTPDEHTINEFFLDVGNGHQVYVQDWGNQKVKTPIIFLHGGPGVGVHDRHKQRFEPTKQRVIFFDQRGCGKSLPYGSLEHNTTPDLVEDIEKIITHLKLNKVILTGGSWGPCLALAFALQYPQRVEALVLQGIFTGSQKEIDFVDQGGFRDFFPEVWEHYAQTVPEKYRANPTAYHTKRILGKNDEAMKASAYAYENLEGAILSLDDRYVPEPYDDYDPIPSRIAAHYLSQGCFLPDGSIMKNAHKITAPVWLVQGRYDAVCPPVNAYELHKKLPNSELIWTIAGHHNDRSNYDVMRTLLLQACHV